MQSSLHEDLPLHRADHEDTGRDTLSKPWPLHKLYIILPGTPGGRDHEIVPTRLYIEDFKLIVAGCKSHLSVITCDPYLPLICMCVLSNLFLEPFKINQECKHTLVIISLFSLDIH